MRTPFALLTLLVGALLALAAPATAQQATATETVRAAGSLWHKGEHDVTGVYRILDRSGDLVLTLDKSFKTRSAPDLKLVLSPHAPDKASSRNALSGGRILAELKSNKGAQEFDLPDDLDLSGYKSLLIHCEAYTKLWAAADLTPGDVVATGGDWKRKSKGVRGNWEVIRSADGKQRLRLGPNFRTDNGPDLKLVLSPHSTRQAKGRNALQGATVIAELTAPKGAQQYDLPAGADPASFNSLLIHCEAYTKLWAASEIRPATR